MFSHLTVSHLKFLMTFEPGDPDNLEVQRNYITVVIYIYIYILLFLFVFFCSHAIRQAIQLYRMQMRIIPILY